MDKVKKMLQALQAMDCHDTERWFKAAEVSTRGLGNYEPGNWRGGFAGSWNSGMTIHDDPLAIILQSAFAAWWAVMIHCHDAGLNLDLCRDWLDERYGRWLVDSLQKDSTRQIGPFLIQSVALQELLEDPWHSPVRAMRDWEPDWRARQALKSAA